MRIAIMSDYIGMSSGYGTDTLEILKELSRRGHEVINMAFQYAGFPVEIEVEPGIKIRVMSAGGQAEMNRSIRYARADYVIHFRDNWAYCPSFSQGMAYHIRDAVHEFGGKAVSFTPVQNLPLPYEFERSVRFDADLTLFPTRWALNYFRDLGYENVDWLPHAIPPGIVPVDIDREHRPFNLPHGTMLMHVGYAGDWRKATPLVLKLLSMYRGLDPSAFAYIHSQRRSWFFNDAFEKNYGLTGNEVFWSPYMDTSNAAHQVDRKDLNRMYNSADIYVNLSTSEGFDHTSLEAASLGIPTLATDFPVHDEVLGNYPAYIPIRSRKDYLTPWGEEWVADVGDALTRLKLLKDTGFQRTAPHVEPEHRVSFVAERLEKLLGGL